MNFLYYRRFEIDDSKVRGLSILLGSFPHERVFAAVLPTDGVHAERLGLPMGIRSIVIAHRI